MSGHFLFVWIMMLALWGVILWLSLDVDRKFRAMDERMWNVENAQ